MANIRKRQRARRNAICDPSYQLSSEEPAINMSNARLQSHSAHMEKLFTEGLNSDITIELSFERFQNKQMKLHKLMLVQLPYFEVLLSGQWAEANQEIIKIKITDDNITERSLDLIFKSLYTGNLTYKTNEDDLISIMATSRMFNLDEAADRVAEEMSNIINAENVIYSYFSFESYGYPAHSKKTLDWIVLNFSYWYETRQNFCSQVLNKIEATLMENIITHDFLIKDEMSLYFILKRWMIDKVKMKDGYDYFEVWNRPEPFFETEEGKKYERIFSMLKINHLLMDKGSVQLLKKDNFFPESYIQRAGAENLITMMQLASPEPSDNVSDQVYQISIFHTLSDKQFKRVDVNYFGHHLTFGWADKMLTVQRNLRQNEMLFNHGPVAITFNIVFHDPSDKKNLPKYSGSIEHVIQENELIYLFKWDHSDWTGALYHFNMNFPSVIGIKMKFRVPNEHRSDESDFYLPSDSDSFDQN